MTEDKPEEEDETIPKVPSHKFLMRRSRTPSPIKEKQEKKRYARCILGSSIVARPVEFQPIQKTNLLIKTKSSRLDFI